MAALSFDARAWLLMTITCSGCDKPIEFTGELTERHTVIYCDACRRSEIRRFVEHSDFTDDVAAMLADDARTLFAHIDALTAALHATKRSDEFGYCASCGQGYYDVGPEYEHFDNPAKLLFVDKHRSNCLVAIALVEPMELP